MKKLEIKDYNIIKKYLDDANYEGYNSNFVNMMMWDHEYNTRYHIEDNYLIMIHNYKGDVFFSMPFCKREYIKDAIEYMLDYCSKNNIIFRMNECIKEVKEAIEDIFKDKFVYLADRNNFDYIYTKESLETLKGKKMQKRRNHFNSFIKEDYDFKYKEIEFVDMDNIFEFLHRWDDEHDDSLSVTSEYVAIMYLLSNIDFFPIKTGCIYIDGKIEAFIIGSPLKHNTVEIHVEKANRDIRGLYVAICKLFLENNFEGYEYINREEDMGLDNLRKSKLALHPIKLIEKYVITTNDYDIRQAHTYDKEDVKSLWLESFKDENDISTNYYFDNIYQDENTFVISNNQKIIGAMQIIPYYIKLNNQEKLTYFVSGVCINTLYQNQGLMKKMISYVLSLEKYQNQMVTLQAYNPQIYKSLGFDEVYFINRYIIQSFEYQYDDIQFSDTIHSNTILSFYNEYCKKYDGQRIRNEEYINKYLINMPDTITNIVKYQGNDVGYISYSIDERNIYINELIISDKEIIKKVVSLLINNYDKPITLNLPIVIEEFGEYEVNCCLMIKDSKIKSNEKLFYSEVY